MHIGTAIFLVALIWFAIAYPGFRKLLVACIAIIAAVILIAIANHYDDCSRQNASYRPTKYDVCADGCTQLDRNFLEFLSGSGSIMVWNWPGAANDAENRESVEFCS
jgi:hypothetical protein